MECRTCSHALVDGARFCDDCGNPSAVIRLDAEALKLYCGRCAAQLRGSRKYCIHCGEPSVNRLKKKDNALMKALLSPRVQLAMVGTLR